MQPDDFQKLMAIFHEAATKPLDDQAAFVDQRCAGDAELAREVLELLESSGRQISIIEGGVELIVDAVLESHEEEAVDLPKSIGEYLILDRIGEGGMGIVYLALQREPERRVALKVLRGGLYSPGRLARFRRETRALARLQHHGIAQIYEAGIVNVAGSGKTPFFAMEFIDGVTAVEFIESRQLDTTARLELFVAICRAVAHAHESEVIHRDLKPGNIVVDGAGNPKVVDFGLARISEAGSSDHSLRTKTGQVVGTIPYMSPEQIAGDATRVDHRTDVYSLGVILYQFLTGRLPFASEETPLAEAARMIATHEAPRPSRADSSYRGDLDTIVLKALEKDIERRYATVEELADDVSRVLRHEPIKARPASALYQVRKFVRRNYGAALGVGGVSVGVTAIIVAINLAPTADSRETADKERGDDVVKVIEDPEIAVDYTIHGRNLAAAAKHLDEEDQASALKYLDWSVTGARGWAWRHLRSNVMRWQAPFESGSRSILSAMSADGRLVFAIARDGRYFRMSEDGLVGEPIHEGRAKYARLSGDGTRFFIHHDDTYDLEVVEVETGARLAFFTLPGMGANIVPTAAGTRVAVTTEKGFHYFDVDERVELFNVPFTGPTTRNFEVSPNGDRVIVRTSQELLELRNGTTGELIDYVPYELGSLGLAWSHDGKTVGFKTFPPTPMETWNVENGFTLSARIAPSLNVRPKGPRCWGSSFFVDGRYATADPGAVLRVWQAPENEPRWSAKMPGHFRRVECHVADDVVISTGLTWIQVDCIDASVAWESQAAGAAVHALAVGADQDLLALASAGSVRIRHHEVELAEFKLEGDTTPEAMAFSRDGTALDYWAGGRRRLDLFTGKTQKTAGDFSQHLASLETPFGADGATRSSSTAHYARLGRAGDVELVACDDGGMMRSIDVRGRPVALALSNRGDEIAIATDEAVLRIFTVTDGVELVAARMPDTEIRSLAFTPDGTRLVVGLKDGSVQVLVKSNLRRVAKWNDHDAAVEHLHFQGEQLVSVSAGGRIVHRDTTSPLDRRRLTWEFEAATAEVGPRIERLARGKSPREVWSMVVGSPSYETNWRHAARAILIRDGD